MDRESVVAVLPIIALNTHLRSIRSSRSEVLAARWRLGGASREGIGNSRRRGQTRALTLCKHAVTTLVRETSGLTSATTTEHERSVKLDIPLVLRRELNTSDWTTVPGARFFEARCRRRDAEVIARRHSSRDRLVKFPQCVLCNSVRGLHCFRN